MEIGSAEHRQLLMKSILRVAIKTMSLGLVVGLVLIIPSWVRENTFSSGLAWLGQAIILVSLVYALVIAIGKYRKTFASLPKPEDD